MTSPIIVRPYVPADYNAVRALYETPATFGGQFDADRDSKDRLDAQSARDAESIFVAEESEKVVGTVSIMTDARFAMLIRFAATDPLAISVLYDEACEILRRRGHRQVLVYAPVADVSFEERYRTLGFTKGDDYTCFWREL